MFEHATRDPEPSGEGLKVLDAISVERWQRSLQSALDGASGLDDAGRVDAIRALEELVCTATAAQAALTVELDASQQGEQAAAAVPAARRGRGIAAQVALARRESPHRGERHLSLARIVTTELPHTWAAWRAGRISEWQATLVARETACLSREDRIAVDASVAADVESLEGLGVRELVAACQRVAYRLDAESFVTRRRRAEAGRHVSLRPAPDCMTWLTALLPVKEGVAAYATLTRSADSARAGGDPRSRGQVMADELVAAVGSRPGSTTGQASSSIALNLVMTDTALFGTSDEPAQLDGYGPIPAELAREIVAGACSLPEAVWLRRLFASPVTGELASADARARLFPHGLGRFIRLRDQICRTPWCDAPIRHIDHAEDWDRGGPTSLLNGQGLCEACNHAKQAPGWRARPGPEPGEIETTTPTGHIHSTGPPVLATIRHAPVWIDYLLAG